MIKLIEMQDYVIDSERLSGPLYELGPHIWRSKQAMNKPLVTVTSKNVHSLGPFTEWSSRVRISDFTVPADTPFETREGLKVENEECRILIDFWGYPYPITESVFQDSYKTE